jgi:hypothetical protein
MSNFIERDALTRVCDLRQVLWYEAKVLDYWDGNPFFAKGIRVTYGLFDTSTGSEGPQIDSRPFESSIVPPPCGGGVPAVVPPVSEARPGDVRSFSVCEALHSKPFEVKEGGLEVTLHSTWHGRHAAPGDNCPPTDNYGVALEQEGLVFGWNTVTSVALPAGKDVTLTWRHLEADTYRLTLFVLKPGSCCVTGHFSIDRFSAPRLNRSDMQA